MCFYFSRFENDSSSLTKQISQEIEQYKKEIADLSEKLQGHEKTSAELEMVSIASLVYLFFGACVRLIKTSCSFSK